MEVTGDKNCVTYDFQGEVVKAAVEDATKLCYSAKTTKASRSFGLFLEEQSESVNDKTVFLSEESADKWVRNAYRGPSILGNIKP